MNIWRHGDVIIETAGDGIAAEETPLPRKDGNVVLADGKATGHAHVLAGDADMYPIVGNSDPLVRGILVVREELPIGHEEHGARVLPPGRYLIRLKRRQDGESWSPVVD